MFSLCKEGLTQLTTHKYHNKCNIQQTRNVFFMQGRFDTTHTHKYHNKCNIQQTRNVFFMQGRFDITHYSLTS